LGSEENRNDRVLDALRREIGDSLAPVRPLRPPWVRAGSVTLSWFLLLGLTLITFGLRRDYSDIGPLASWGISALQWLVAYGVAWSGLRLAVPGDLMPGSGRALLLFSGYAVHFVGAWWAFRVSPSWVEPGQELRMTMVCFVFISLLALVPLVLAIRLVSQGLLTDSLHAGILIGLSAGLAAEGAWRMHCPFTSWEHIYSGHSPAVLAVTLAGFIWFRRKSRASREREA